MSIHSFGERNVHASHSHEPITRQQVQTLRRELGRFWEDTQLVTKPNQYPIIYIGHLEALCDALLASNDFDNPQMSLGG